ncbi:hypothetical protein [Hafnia paralvei]|uniref:hypothetical protein n=1 Tax=Hafnia paralvei TaxID=546367 RepID=UPI0038D04B90
MTKLTTERLDKLQDNLLQFQDAYSDPADKENYDIFVDALHMLDEFKAAKEKLIAYEQAAEHPAARITWDGSEFSVSNVSEDFLYGGTAVYLAPVLPKQPRWPAAEVERDALRYRFLRDKDFFGDEDEPGLVGWEGLVELGYNEFDAAVDARISHPDIDYVKLDTALRKHIPAQPVIPEQPEPTISFYRDGIIAAAKWVENQRDAYDNEHGQSDPETGSFEFGNNAQLEYSTTLSEIAEGIRSLHSVSAQPVSEPYKLEIDMDDADHFSITHLHEIIYGKELIWPEAKLLARFMLDVKQRVSAAPSQESE